MNKISVLNVLNNAKALLMIDNTEESILLRCLNICVSDIASNYFDCIDTQKFNVTDNKITYESFERRFFKIIKVTHNGSQVNHSLFIDHIRVSNGVVAVEYAYIPEIKAASDVISLPRLNEEGLTCGLMAEYALVSGMFSEAKVWNEKFNNFLFSNKVTGKNIAIKPQRWR